MPLTGYQYNPVLNKQINIYAIHGLFTNTGIIIIISSIEI